MWVRRQPFAGDPDRAALGTEPRAGTPDAGPRASPGAQSASPPPPCPHPHPAPPGPGRPAGGTDPAPEAGSTAPSRPLPASPSGEQGGPCRSHTRPRPRPNSPEPGLGAPLRAPGRQARAGLCGMGRRGVRGAAPQSPGPRGCDAGLSHPRGWLPAAHRTLQALCASASRDPSPSPSRAPLGPLPARSRSSPPRSCAPTLRKARGAGTGTGSQLAVRPGCRKCQKTDPSTFGEGRREGGGGEERAAAKPGRDPLRRSGRQGPRSPWSLRVLCLSWAPLPGTLGGSRSLRRSFGGRSGHSPKNGQEAGRGGGGGQWD